MRPVPIPDARIWAYPNGAEPERRTLGAPRGYEADVHPIEVLIEDPVVSPPPGPGPSHLADLGAQVHVLCALEDGDLEALTADPHLWLTFWGAVVPFALTVPGNQAEKEEHRG